ncbi:hypothetical protein ATB53_04365 [Xanthomonas translucens]|uniref:Uncharacterized protein n=1 Tax=Xanthomonas campestris pv. translucens TaxID=343 RepID=A0A109HIM9_XANCT|nr:hypothetical protein OZ12_07220 [Xanthomonas translucens pv. translucens]KWV12870.1 hypothetical protein ATB54_03640 [Xanthomonas translucens]KWV13442.1 hypothetical protein ATB53_04365 [Xanthomonas translucens]OAX57424.1 hypothetical protein A6R79_15440 [Xanthomonas translucens pv. translucens]
MLKQVRDGKARWISIRRSKRVRTLTMAANQACVRSTPAMSPQPLIALDPFARDAGSDPSSFEVRAAALDIVGLVGI